MKEIWYKFKWDATFEREDDIPLQKGGASTKRPSEGIMDDNRPSTQSDPAPLLSEAETRPATCKEATRLLHSLTERVEGSNDEKDGVGSSGDKMEKGAGSSEPSDRPGEAKPLEALATPASAASAPSKISSLPPASQNAMPACSSSAEALQFYEEFVAEVASREEDSDTHFSFDTCSLRQLADWLEECSHSSAFSGVGASQGSPRSAAREEGLVGVGKSHTVLC